MELNFANYFYGTKKVIAVPMTRFQYNGYRGWDLPSNENGADEGYMVEYVDGGSANDDRHTGYISWSPKDVFEAAYQPTDAMSFGHAIAALKDGKKVARAGWNGKGMFLYYVKANSYPATSGIAKEYFGTKAGTAMMMTSQGCVDKYKLENIKPSEVIEVSSTNDVVVAVPLVPYRAYIAMKTVDEDVVVWTASQTDVLADDWQIIA